MKKFLIFLIIIPLSLFSQELAYVNTISDYLQLNPAFAGSKNLARISVNNQLRWYNAIHQTYYNTFSFDFALGRKGFGMHTSVNKLSNGFMSSNWNLALSYRIGKLRKFIFVPAIQLSYKGYFLNTNDLIFYDQLSVYDEVYTESQAVVEVKNHHLIGLSGGFIIQFPISLRMPYPFWFNFSYAIENIPDLSLTIGSNALLYFPPKHNLYAGFLIPLQIRDSKTKLWKLTKITLYPHIRYFEQGNYNLINTGTLIYLTYFKKLPIIIGLGQQNFKTLSLLNKNQLFFTLGFQRPIGKYINLEFLYSNDMGASFPINNNTLFITHEFSIVIHFVNRRKTDCPEKLKFNAQRWYNQSEVQTRIKDECPPGLSKRRQNTDIYPMFYPIELPKPYLPDEKSIF